VSTLPALPSRISAVVREVGKFGAIGAVAYVIDVGIFNLLRFGVELGPLTSKTLSTIVAMTFAYAGNRYWTWRDRPRHGVRREYAMFALVNGGGLAIQLALLGFTVYILDVQGKWAENLAGNVFGVIVGTIFRFWAYRTWVFPQLPEPDQVDEALEQTTITPY
jgi:putative flippase GtrA